MASVDRADADPPRREPSGGDPSTAGSGRPRLRDAAGSLLATLASAGRTRIELASLELAEERERTKQRLALLLLVAIAAGFAVLAGSVLFVLASWDRLGLYSVALLLIVYAGVAGVGAWRLATLARQQRRPFDATLSELERDRAWLAEHFGSRP